MADFEFILTHSVFREALKEQKAVIEDFWSKAAGVLEGSGITLQKLPPRFTKLRRNYFSVLFIAAYHALGISPKRRALYARINHCLRAWVTACDNLLDRELKEMLLTDLPESAQVFKSVHTLMVTDRVFFAFLLDALDEGTIDESEMRTLMNLSLRSITESGVEEAGEEGGVDFDRFSPKDIMRDIHAYKAGSLFTATLAAPEVLVDIPDRKRLEHIRSGIYQFGLACQILDDLADLAEDILSRKYNYLAALITHGKDSGERELFDSLLEKNTIREGTGLFRKFPKAMAEARKELSSRFERSLRELNLGGLPFSGPLRSAFLKGLGVVYRQPDLMAKLRR